MSGLRSGELAAAAGVNVQTIRYYERRGLLADPDRTLGGHRKYPADAVTTVRVIKAAQRLGFTLAEVAELMEVPRRWHGRGRDADLRHRTEAKLHEVEARIADLAVVRDTLRAALEAGCDDLAACSATPGCPLELTQLAGDRGSSGEVR